MGVSVKKRTFYRTSVLLDLPIAALPAGGRHPRPSTPGSLCTSSAHLPSPVELLTAVSKALWPPASSPHGLPPGPKNSAHPRLLDLLPPQAVHAWCHPSFCRPGPHCSRCIKVPVLPDGLDGSCSFSAFNIHVSTYLLLKVPGFRRCLQAFSSCGEWGLLSPAVTGVSLWGVSWCGEWASAVAVPRLSCPKTHRIFPDQRLNPCPLHWQVDAQPRGHQGSPAAS